MASSLRVASDIVVLIGCYEYGACLRMDTAAGAAACFFNTLGSIKAPAIAGVVGRVLATSAREA